MRIEIRLMNFQHYELVKLIYCRYRVREECMGEIDVGELHILNQ